MKTVTTTESPAGKCFEGEGWDERAKKARKHRSKNYLIRHGTPLVLCLVLSSHAFAGAFSEAIDYAQRRTVKVYGAAIGRISGYGTGIIVSRRGDILTAQGIHLSSGQLRVTLHDGTTHAAKVIRRNEQLQLALLKIDVQTSDFFPLHEAPSIEVGDWILAVSNAFKVADGAEPLSVNLGVVSLRTPLRGTRGVQDFTYDGDVLVIDAITSNPGSAGGAVVTADKRLAGMIGKVIESKSTNTRLNYAVPADLLAKFVANEKTTVVNSNVTPASNKPVDLGVRLFRLGGRQAPAYIDRVLPNSPAARAGLKPDDLIVSIDGRPVTDASTYQRIVDTLRPASSVELVVKRRRQLLQVELEFGPTENQ